MERLKRLKIWICCIRVFHKTINYSNKGIFMYDAHFPLSHHTVLCADYNSCVLFIRLVGLIQPWHLQLHRRGWCLPSSSLWHLLIEPLWHSSSPLSKPTAALPATPNTRPWEFIRATASRLPPDIGKRTAHRPGLTRGWMAKDGVLRGARSQSLILRAQSPQDWSPAEETHKKATAKLQVFMRKSS